MKKYVPGKGWVPVSTIPHKRPVRTMPSLRGKLMKNPKYKPPKKKKPAKRKKTTRTVSVPAAPKKQLPKLKKRGWFW